MRPHGTVRADLFRSYADAIAASECWRGHLTACTTARVGRQLCRLRFDPDEASAAADLADCALEVDGRFVAHEHDVVRQHDRHWRRDADHDSAFMLLLLSELDAGGDLELPWGLCRHGFGEPH